LLKSVLGNIIERREIHSQEGLFNNDSWTVDYNYGIHLEVNRRPTKRNKINLQRLIGIERELPFSQAELNATARSLKRSPFSLGWRSRLVSFKFRKQSKFLNLRICITKCLDGNYRITYPKWKWPGKNRWLTGQLAGTNTILEVRRDILLHWQRFKYQNHEQTIQLKVWIFPAKEYFLFNSPFGWK